MLLPLVGTLVGAFLWLALGHAILVPLAAGGAALGAVLGALAGRKVGGMLGDR